ncbi:hypothetical protein NDN08_004352 [Rhodosorus marinus]|uniref:16S rRNA (uracil(1498)-N(3))-methyltransferase n=1 Tax=Rhodosorus marinus TaxID=101924 RepID=A0AAV8UL73_9RHOD|nr:hypothetical protein NDN08_004352 [Rhodosorus marinus]
MGACGELGGLWFGFVQQSIVRSHHERTAPNRQVVCSRLSVGGLEDSHDRVYLPGLRTAVAKCLVDVEESKHFKSRRISSGKKVELFDGLGRVNKAEFIGFEKNRAEVLVGDTVKTKTPPIDLTAAIAFPKGARADWMVEKLTELGVSTIITLKTERSEGQVSPSKLERWRRLAVSACKQCRRDFLPTIHTEETSIPQLAERIRAKEWSVSIVAAFGGLPLNQVERRSSKCPVIIVGPEGGLTTSEEEQLLRSGCQPVSLGQNRLRVETASIGLAASLLIAFDESGSQAS